ncbi:hypothetical protein ACIBEK_09405 [Nocardia fusca]|uniref:hypothetical protein n=1 Tax=Nocardia fusca TaxID=941183 RepID=UPI00379DA75F
MDENGDAGNRGEVALGLKQFISVPDLHSGGQFQRGDAAAVFGDNDDSAHALGDQQPGRKGAIPSRWAPAPPI